MRLRPCRGFIIFIKILFWFQNYSYFPKTFTNRTILKIQKIMPIGKVNKPTKKRITAIPASSIFLPIDLAWPPSDFLSSFILAISRLLTFHAQLVQIFLPLKEQLAKECQAWCSKHKSCNLEITKYAVNL